MGPGITAAVAEWAAGVRSGDLPSSVIERARLQVASVLGATFAGARSSLGRRVAETSLRWGSGEDASLIPFGPRASVHTAAYVNAACSVAFDYDDYLFAGHTGHCAVLGSLAVGEAAGASGSSVLTAIVVANETAGRLGAALLLGPHNGQMWALIHAIGGAVAAGRLYGLDATRLRHAIGIALANPPYPLAAGFFGPDSKALIASGPLVEGIRAAELAASGVTGAEDILSGVFESMATRPLGWAFSGLGSAWVTDSLTFKTFPGCAYVDTPVEAFGLVREQFANKHARELTTSDIARIRVDATVFTAGMDSMSEPFRSRERLRAVDVNFSVGLSLGVALASGGITPASLEPASLESHRSQILEVADRTTVEHDPALTFSSGGLSDLGIEMMRVLNNDATYTPSLDGADFTKFRMRFPARVTLSTTAGEEYSAEVDAPVGAAGRDLAETTEAVREKFVGNASHLSDPSSAYDAVTSFDSVPSIRDVVEAVTAR